MRKTSGLSLLLLIFLSLCLVTFSLLSVSESSADKKLSEKAAQHTTDYYHALSEANETLATIDEALSGCIKAASASDAPAKAYLDRCASIPDTISGISWERTADDTGVISFQTVMTDRQSLLMELTVHWPAHESDTLYEITRQQVIHTATWTPDTSQKLYLGQEDSGINAQ